MTRFITRSGWRRLIGWCLSSWWVVVSYAGDITVAVTFDDPDQRYVDRYDEVISNLAGAAGVWGEHLMIHPNAVLDIDV